jgi:acyl dehydratase
VTFDAEAIRAFATAAGDANPLHHDAEAAAASRFGGLIASGTHYGALMMGLLATELTGHGPGVGMEFALRFRRPVRSGATMRLEWVVTDIRPSPRQRGSVVTVEGTVADAATGEVAATTTGKCMMFGGA